MSLYVNIKPKSKFSIGTLLTHSSDSEIKFVIFQAMELNMRKLIITKIKYGSFESF